MFQRQRKWFQRGCLKFCRVLRITWDSQWYYVKKCQNICYVKYNNNKTKINLLQRKKKTHHRFQRGFCLVYRKSAENHGSGNVTGQKEQSEWSGASFWGLLAQASVLGIFVQGGPELLQPAPKETSCQSHNTLFFRVFFIVFNMSSFFFC